MGIIVTFPASAELQDGSITTALLADNAVEAAKIAADAVTSTKLAAGVAGEGHITILPWNYSAVDAGTWAIAFDAAEIPVWNNTSAANADACSYKAYLVRGTYTFCVYGRKFSVAGITDFLLNAVSQGTIDWYDAGSVQNSRQTIANVVIATDGLYTIQMKVNGKNASSGGFQLRIGNIVPFRTA